jgi:hypothetical protein
MTYHRGCNKYHNPVIPSFMTYHQGCSKYHNPVLPSYFITGVVASNIW